MIFTFVAIIVFVGCNNNNAFDFSQLDEIDKQGDYEFAKFHRVSAATQFRFAKNYFQPSLTIAYDGLFFNMIDVCVAYTMQRRSFDNLGVGIGFNLGYLNVYAGTQNIIAAFSVKSASQLTGTVGIVFNWGHFDNWRKNNPKK